MEKEQNDSYSNNNFINKITKITGKLSFNFKYEPPKWIKQTNDKTKTNWINKSPLTKLQKVNYWVWFSIILSFMILLNGSYLLYEYINTKDPTKVYIKVTGTKPSATPLKKNAKPDKLYLFFNHSVAKVNLLDKEIIKGIEINPKINGKWIWKTDKKIEFTPEKDWQVGTDYEVKLDKTLFSDHIILENNTYQFKTAEFKSYIKKFYFYIDPHDSSKKKVIANINFSHPVQADEFEKSINLELVEKTDSWRKTKSNFNFKVTYDEFKGKAYIHSDPIPIPKNSAVMNLIIDNDFHSSKGGGTISKSLNKTVRVPGLDYYKVKSINIEHIKSDDLDQDFSQILTVNTSGNITPEQVKKHIEAYLLPIDRPELPGLKEKKNYMWSNPAEIGPEVLELSKKINLELVETERKFSKSINLSCKVHPKRFLYIKLNKNMEFYGQYILTKDYDHIVQTPDYPSMLKIMHEGSILSMSGEKKLTIISHNVDQVQFNIAKVLPDQINHLVSQTNGDFSNPYFETYRFSKNNLTENYKEIRHLNNSESGKLQYFSFDFSKYLESTSHNSRNGLFLFTVKEYRKKKKKKISKPFYEGITILKYFDDNNYDNSSDDNWTANSHYYYEDEYEEEEIKVDKRFILVTDLGILVKDSKNYGEDLFVQSINNGDPINNAVVRVIGKNGLTILRSTSDNSGMVHIPALYDFKKEKSPTAYVVEKDGDLAFLPYTSRDRKLNFSRFEIGGRRGEHNPNRLRAFLFSDRGIYRPGDTIKLGMIVKSGNWDKNIAGVPVEVAISDSRGVEIYKKKIKLSNLAFEEFEYQCQETSPTGRYEVSAYITHDKERTSLLGYTMIKVKEFLPDRLKIKSKFSKKISKGWISPKDLKATVDLQNLFGIPSHGNKIKGKLRLTPANFYFWSYKDYYFNDPYYAKKDYEEDLGEQKTDKEGKATFNLDLSRFETASYKLHFLVEGFEKEGGRAVTTESSILVSPLSYLIGYKPDGDLEYTQKNTPRLIDIIALNPKLNKMAVSDLRLNLNEIRYVSVLTKQEDGTYKYQSTKKVIPIKETKIKIPEEGLKYNLPTDQAGDYEIIIYNQDNIKLNTVHFSVIGDGELTRSLERDAELKIKLDADKYEPGQVIEVNIIAPYHGYGLITIERDKVYTHKWFKTSTNSSTQTIQVPDDLDGNGYVNVSFIRNPDSKEIYSSPLSYGVVPFKISYTNRNNEIYLNIPNKAKPGIPFKIEYSSDEPGKIIIFAIDEGILQVAGYQTPDPLSYYFRKRALEVNTYQILDLILPEYSVSKAVSAFGGDAPALIGKNLNPFKRKRHMPIAYWSGIIDTDSTTRSVTYNVPDYFNGTLRVMAVVVSEDKIGAIAKKSIISNDLVISPNVPVVVSPEDKFDVSVSLANNVIGSENLSNVQLKLEVSDELEILNKNIFSLDLDEKDEKTITFQLKAKNKLGSPVLKFSASKGNYYAKKDIGLSVRPAVPYITKVISGYFNKGTKTINIDRSMYPHFRSLEAGFSILPIGLSKGLSHYLEKFPYLCTEQLVSQAFSSFTMGTNPIFGYSEKKMDKTISETLKILQSRQNNEGAFGFWAANSHVSDFQVVYALHFLTELKEKGIYFPEKLLTNGLQYLEKKLLKTMSDDKHKLRIQSYAVYILTRNEIVTTNYINSIHEKLDRFYKGWEKDLAGVYLSACYQILNQNREAKLIQNQFSLDDDIIIDYNNYYDPLIRNSQYLYILAKHFPKRFSKISGDAIQKVIQPIIDEQFNTLSSSYTLLMLSAMAESVEENSEKIVNLYEILDQDKTKLIDVPIGIYPRIKYSSQANSLKVNNLTNYNIFYQIIQAGFDLQPPTESKHNQIEVFREYLDENGKVVTETKLGAKVEVRLKIRSLDNNTFNNIAIVDLLPGGFEVIDDSARTGKGFNLKKKDKSKSSLRKWNPEYVDVREDRVLLFGTVNQNIAEYRYLMRSTNKGEFRSPPIYAESMYNRKINSISKSGSIKVVSDNN